MDKFVSKRPCAGGAASAAETSSKPKQAKQAKDRYVGRGATAATDGRVSSLEKDCEMAASAVKEVNASWQKLEETKRREAVEAKQAKLRTGAPTLTSWLTGRK